MKSHMGIGVLDPKKFRAGPIKADPESKTMRKNRSGPTDHPREKPINPRRLSRTANLVTATGVPLFHDAAKFFQKDAIARRREFAE